MYWISLCWIFVFLVVSLQQPDPILDVRLPQIVYEMLQWGVDLYRYGCGGETILWETLRDVRDLEENLEIRYNCIICAKGRAVMCVYTHKGWCVCIHTKKGVVSRHKVKGCKRINASIRCLVRIYNAYIICVHTHVYARIWRAAPEKKRGGGCMDMYSVTKMLSRRRPLRTHSIQDNSTEDIV